MASIAVKLRIRDNSVRLRLQRGEVDTLCDTGSVAARTEFPGGGELRYRIDCSPQSEQPMAVFVDNTVGVRLPQALVQDWAKSDQVGITGEQQLDDGSILQILVEKDFACLAPRAGENEADMYPHPNATSKGSC